MELVDPIHSKQPNLRKIFSQWKIDNCIFDGIVFGKFSRFKILMKRGYLTIVDVTHNINRLHWKWLTIMIKHKYGNWILGAHMLCEYKDGDIISVFSSILQ